MKNFRRSLLAISVVMFLLVGCGPNSIVSRTPSPTLTIAPTATPIPPIPTLYLGENDKLIALDPSDGSKRWQFQDNQSVFDFYQLVYSNGTVFGAGSKTHNAPPTIRAIKTKDQTVEWETTLDVNNPDGVIALSYFNGVIYAGTNIDGIYALNAITGKVLWKSALGSIGFWAITATNGVVYVGAGDSNTLYALKESDGSVLWKFAGDNRGDFNRIFSTPAVSNGVVYVGTDAGYIYALNSLTGSLVWKYDVSIQNAIEKDINIINGVVYAGLDTIYAINALNGHLI